jgi:hypothetical protein
LSYRLTIFAIFSLSLICLLDKAWADDDLPRQKVIRAKPQSQNPVARPAPVKSVTIGVINNQGNPTPANPKVPAQNPQTQQGQVSGNSVSSPAAKSVRTVQPTSQRAVPGQQKPLPAPRKMPSQNQRPMDPVHTAVTPNTKPIEKRPDEKLATPQVESNAFPVQKLMRKLVGNKKVKSRAFYYVSTSYISFADQIFAKVSGIKQHARAVFTGYSLGTDYTRYMARYIYSWNLNFLTGAVDIERVFGATYPRKSFWGIQSGPELGYRVNSDLDLTYGLNLMYRDIDGVGPSFALDNQLNLKFRFSPRLTFFQSLGNYGKPTSYSYSIGLRWLL